MSKQLTPLEAWKILYREWQAAHIEARGAREALTTLFQRAVEKGGAVPTQAQVDECLKLERAADFLAKELDKLACRYLN